MRSRSASSFRQLLLITENRPARPTCAEFLGGPGWVANQETVLHAGDHLAGSLQLGADPIQAIGMEPNRRLGQNGRRIELIGDRDPDLAGEPALCEPAAQLSP